MTPASPAATKVLIQWFISLCVWLHWKDWFFSQWKEPVLLLRDWRSRSQKEWMLYLFHILALSLNLFNRERFTCPHNIHFFRLVKEKVVTVLLIGTSFSTTVNRLSNLLSIIFTFGKNYFLPLGNEKISVITLCKDV